jgi:hypothetical protein
LLAAGCQPPSEPKAGADPQPEIQVSPQPQIQIGEADAAAIVELGRDLIKADDTRKDGTVAILSRVQGPEIEALRGTFPRVEEDGVYFRKGFFCVGKERGLFVPRNAPAFAPPATGGVTYVRLSHDLYRYERAC